MTSEDQRVQATADQDELRSYRTVERNHREDGRVCERFAGEHQEGQEPQPAL